VIGTKGEDGGALNKGQGNRVKGVTPGREGTVICRHSKMKYDVSRVSGGLERKAPPD